MNSQIRNPLQPIVHERGTYRFKQNAIVRYLLDNGVDWSGLQRTARETVETALSTKASTSSKVQE